VCKWLDDVATHNTLQYWTVVITSPFHLLGAYRRDLESRKWVWDIKELVWNKVTMHFQPISNIPGNSVISNCEGMVVAFCKKSDISVETAQLSEHIFYASSELKWLVHHPLYTPSSFRETAFTCPIQDKKVEDQKTGKAVNKSEKPTALGEYMVNLPYKTCKL